MAIGDPGASRSRGEDDNGGDAREAAIAAGGRSRTGAAPDTGGETARERGIRTAATSETRTRARSGPEGRQSRAFTRDFASRMRAAQTPDQTGPFSFVGDLFTKAKEALDEKLDSLRDPDVEDVAKGAVNVAFGSPVAAALAGITNTVNEAMREAGHRPGDVPSHPTGSFRGATAEQDDWGGFRDAMDAHDAERGGPGTREQPTPQDAPVAPTPTPSPATDTTPYTAQDLYWYNRFGYDPQGHFAGMGTGATGMTGGRATGEAETEGQGMLASRRESPTGPSRTLGMEGTSPALAYLSRVDADIRRSRSQRLSVSV